MKIWLKTNLSKGMNFCLSNTCTLDCVACLRYELRNNNLKPGMGGGNLTLEDLDKLLKYVEIVDINGQVSDPIFNPHFEQILKMMHKRITVDAPDSCLIHTAATSKKFTRDHYKRWFVANPKAMWIFGIDGLPEESCMYRRNQDGQFLFDMMVMATEMGLNTIWQYIVFNYNENSIDEAKQLAKKYNLNLQLVISSRWHGFEYMKPTNPDFAGKYYAAG